MSAGGGVSVEWRPDVLGDGFELATFPLRAADGETPVATLVRHAAAREASTAVLYLHGFNDYFFQRPLAEWFERRSTAFYALDLRRHGRSLLPGQIANYTSDLREYDEELDQAAAVILGAGHERLVLVGHSTGGLVLPLWAARRQELPVAGMILNSPFLEFRQPAAVRAVLTPAIGLVARGRPALAIPAGVDRSYGDSLHSSRHGEWDYDLAWKPSPGFPARVGWIRTVAEGHRKVRSGLGLPWPVLVMASDRAVDASGGMTGMQRGDAVLDPDSIARRSCGLGRHVTTIRVEGGMHDLVLSPEPVRSRVYDLQAAWLDAWIEPAEPRR